MMVITDNKGSQIRPASKVEEVRLLLDEGIAPGEVMIQYSAPDDIDQFPLCV